MHAAVAVLDRARTMFVPPETASRDVLVKAIARICHKVFGTNFNDEVDVLGIVGVGQVTRERVVGQYRSYLRAARKAGWDMVVEGTKPTLAGEIDI